MGKIHPEEMGSKALAQLLNGPCGNILSTAISKVKDELSYTSLLKEYDVLYGSSKLLTKLPLLESQYYVNSKQHHLINLHLHAESNPYGSDNMFAAGGRGIFYSKHLGRRKASGGPRTQRNSPFTEKHALSSCHG